MRAAPIEDDQTLPARPPSPPRPQLILASLWIIALLLGPAGRAANTVPEGYVLAWSDEFNQDGPPGPSDWGFEQGFVRNRELQWYQPQNAVCKDGLLIIEARREHRPNPRYSPAATAWQTNREFIEYTSASINTRGKHTWTYGRFEVRARIDTRAGSWPAFWMLGTNGRWPASGEIDIMEYYRRELLFNVAWARGDNQRAKWNSQWKPLSNYPEDWSTKFHVWRMDWDRAGIRLYLDDELVNSQPTDAPLPDAAPGDNPFRGPMYLLINLAIGGQQGGDPTGTEFPVRYEVDYVRVYQKLGQSEPQ